MWKPPPKDRAIGAWELRLILDDIIAVCEITPVQQRLLEFIADNGNFATVRQLRGVIGKIAGQARTYENVKVNLFYARVQLGPKKMTVEFDRERGGYVIRLLEKPEYPKPNKLYRVNRRLVPWLPNDTAQPWELRYLNRRRRPVTQKDG